MSAAAEASEPVGAGRDVVGGRPRLRLDKRTAACGGGRRGG